MITNIAQPRSGKNRITAICIRNKNRNKKLESIRETYKKRFYIDEFRSSIYKSPNMVKLLTSNYKEIWRGGLNKSFSHTTMSMEP